jgi:uncharacterized phage protein (TIGR02218 family)
MRDIPAPMAAALGRGATTFARCWRVERRDGVVLGFTDHDGDIAFDGDVYRAETGMTASAAESALGLAAAGLDVVGALDDAGLSEADLARGLYDGAGVKLFLVDWRDPGSRVLLFAGALGEIARERRLFTAELRGLAHALQQPQGRLYQRGCDADLGDARCGIDLASALYRAEGVVTAVAGGRAFTAAVLAGRDSVFTRGRLLWTSGANVGAACEIRRHEGALVELAEIPPIAIAAGDAFTATAGCDKSFATCRNTFFNQDNFRGFPHMPGNDWLGQPARADGGNDGGRLV